MDESTGQVATELICNGENCWMHTFRHPKRPIRITDTDCIMIRINKHVRMFHSAIIPESDDGAQAFTSHG